MFFESYPLGMDSLTMNPSMSSSKLTFQAHVQVLLARYSAMQRELSRYFTIVTPLVVSKSKHEDVLMRMSESMCIK